MSDVLALALDLGSTTIKAGLLDAGGGLAVVASAPAPPLRGEGLVREGDPEAFLARALAVLQAARRHAPSDVPVGVATQRSTFAVWDRAAGRFLTPLVSWQDRRAREWCVRHETLGADVAERTGLLLSPHYLGPKLAAMQEADSTLRDALASGRARVGTLDTLLLARLSGGVAWETDPTVASRTLLFDLVRDGWSPNLLAALEFPAACLPEIRPSSGRGLLLPGGLRLEATVADQPAGVAAAIPSTGAAVLVNLGTGGFVLRPSGADIVLLPGYLTGRLPRRPGEPPAFAVEGAINGLGPAFAPFGEGPTALPETDPSPEAYAVPDATGLGSPHWRPEIGVVMSAAALELPLPERRRVLVEGVVFRVVEILEGLDAAGIRLLLSGGLSRDPAFARGLAAVLGRPVHRLEQPEAVLLGTARLAAGLPAFGNPPTAGVEPGPAGAYLPRKFIAWRAWLGRLMQAREDPPPGRGGTARS